MDNSTKKLLNGSMIYFVGNALTQLISLLLMRFVTGNITPEEYGFFNLVTTVSNLVIPFVTLQISDAVFKFVLKSETEDEKKSYFTTCFVVSFVSVCVIVASVFVLSCFVNIPNTFLVAIYVSSSALYGVYQKVVRCLNKNTIFVTGNLIKTIIFLTLEIFLISALNLGIDALLIAHILSLLFFLVYAELRVHALNFFDIRTLKLDVFSKMMRFSIPLIPNAVFWWLTSSVNHVIVSAKLGMDVNGIYTVSSKFSAVVVMVTSVLNMSWQDTAIADYGSNGFREFFTKTFNSFVKLIFSALVVLLPFVALVIPFMIDPSYYSAIQYSPFLLLAAVVSAMSGFIAQIFTAKGNTKVLLLTSVMGMIVNILVIGLLISKIGLWAAVIGALSADTVIFCARLFMARKEFAKGIQYKSFILILVMLVVGIYIYLNASSKINLIWFAITAIVALILNFEFIKNILTLIFGSFFKKKKTGGDAE